MGTPNPSPSEAFTADLWTAILCNDAGSLRAAALMLSAKESAALVSAAHFHDLPDLWSLETRADSARRLTNH